MKIIFPELHPISCTIIFSLRHSLPFPRSNSTFFDYLNEEHTNQKHDRKYPAKCLRVKTIITGHTRHRGIIAHTSLCPNLLRTSLELRLQSNPSFELRRNILRNRSRHSKQRRVKLLGPNRILIHRPSIHTDL